MSDVLCTFSGPNGDILWSLATVREIAKIVDHPVDMAVMGTYENLIPLLQRQSYINKATAVKEWVATGSNFGDQPWYPPKEVELPYKTRYHLTYRNHPGLSQVPASLIDFIAHQQGFALRNPIPFIECDDVEGAENTIAVGFNYQYMDLKYKFVEYLKELCPNYDYLDVTKLPWKEASSWIKASVGFVGCRSSNNVIAHGVKQDNIFIYEPHPSRHQDGMLGNIFGNPYHGEMTAAHSRTPRQTAEFAATFIRNWKKREDKEHAIA